MRSAKEFFFAWRKPRNVMRNAGQKNWPISANQFRRFPTRSGDVYNDGWTVRSEPRSRFAEWKRPKKNMKLHFDQRERVLAGEHDVKDFLRESAVEEKAHARALQTMVPQLGPRTAPDTVLRS